MARNRHPKKEVEAAVAHAEAHGWGVVVGGSHAWGRTYCPSNGKCRDGVHCISQLWSTPRDHGVFAAQLRRAVDNSPFHSEK